MGILKPVLMLAILSSVMVCNNAWATDPPPRVGATRSEPAVAPKVPPKVPPKAPPQAEPAAQPHAPGKKPVKRRCTRQIPYEMAPVTAPPVSAPRLNPAPAGAAPLPSPLILNGCPGAGCTDSSGARYQGGVGNTLLGPDGRACSNNGITVQCF